MLVDIVTPEKKLFSEEVESVTIPTNGGQITVLPHHENLVASLASGELVVRTKKQTQYFGLTGGFLEITNNTVSILADYAVKSEDIVVEKAVAAQKRAEEVLKKTKEGITERDFALAQTDLRKALMELHVAHKHRSRKV